MTHHVESAERPVLDPLLHAMADYALGRKVASDLAYDTAVQCLMDSLARGFQALEHPACARLLGPVVPGATLTGGARVPGTSYELDPVDAAFSIGAMTGWLGGDDTGPAAQWGQPSDHLGAILAVADYLSRSGRPVVVRDMLTALIKAHEIRGILALENRCERGGLDHVTLVRVASTAVVTALFGGNREQVAAALSNAWADGGVLRTDRPAPHTGARPSWAAGDAASRAVRLALFALKGEPGCGSTPSARNWGCQDALVQGRPPRLPQPLGSQAMENMLFRIPFPAGVPAQTAVEAAVTLHPLVRAKLDRIDRVRIETQEPGMRILGRTEPLSDPADRARCLRYLVAIPLLFGRLLASDYEDEVARDPRIDALRSAIQVEENATFTAQFHAADQRCLGNAVQVFFRDGTATPRVALDCPLGHRRRRAEGAPVLQRQFETSVAAHFGIKQTESIQRLCADRAALAALPVSAFVARLVRPA